ncbi:uncharacterized protein LOC106453790 [Brassica napus]|uniref:uncharacterized protein LOC106453790 n=1 Tax=Brassica napus TaxID=3708 RepID=UPI0006AAF950|nr:uncharacterized protein LOC106453790 [Brassica napus]
MVSVVTAAVSLQCEDVVFYPKDEDRNWFRKKDRVSSRSRGLMERAKLPFKKCFSWNRQIRSYMRFMVGYYTKEKETREMFANSPKTRAASSSASASVSGSSCGGDDDARSDDDGGGSFDLAGYYEKLYEHWLNLVQANSDLAKEKAKLEAQIAKALKYASEKEEEARQAGAQLAETQKGLRMLNNGTDQLDHLLSIGQSDRCGLGYQGECFKARGVVASAGKTKDVGTSDTKLEVKRFARNATNGKTAVKHATDVKNLTATRTAATSTATATATPRCFKLLREKNQMEQAYGMKYHGPICYSCGVQGHMRHDCFRSVQGANHGGFGLKNKWSRRFNHYGDGGIGFPPHFDHDVTHRGRLKTWFSIQR